MVTARVVSESITVGAPADVVFAILADPRQHVRIDGSGTVRGSVSGPERLRLGASFGMSMRLLVPYRITNRVVDFEEGRRIVWRHVGGHRWGYALDRVDGGTHVTESFDYSRQPALQARLLELGGVPGRNATAIHQTLLRLKVAAEADAAP